MRVHNEHLLFRTKKPAAILDKIPDAKILESNREGVHACAVRWDHPHRVPNAQALTCLKMKNIPFVTDDYVFPEGRKPFQHQIESVEFLVARSGKRKFNLSTMGVGKTSSSVWACDYLMTHGYVDRVVVVAPLSILKAAWENDIRLCTPHRSVAVVHGSKSKRVEMLEGPAKDWYIINYDGLTIIEKEFKKLTEKGVTAWVVDESTYIKNSATRRFKSLNRLIKPDDYVQCLTGSPCFVPTDAHGQVLLINPDNVPRSKERWKLQTMTQVNKFVWVPRYDSQEKIRSVMQPAIRYKKEDCLDLPPVLYSKRKVPLSKEQQTAYKKLQRELILEYKKGVVTASTASAQISKLLQICTGSVYLTESGGDTIQLDCSPRIKELEAVIDEAATKTVAFVPFRATLDFLQKHFDDTRGSGYARTIRGGVSLKTRSEIVDIFMDPNSKMQLLLCQPQATSHGLSFVSASTAIWFSPPSNFSAETFTQACARLDRPGQQAENVSIVQLSGSSMEDKIYHKVEGKLKSSENLLELYGELIETPVNG
jgi:SNF2 family DNA or RNA helicase